MICRACNEPHASSVKSIVENGSVVDVGCDRCMGVAPTIPDVYWPGHTYKSEALETEFTSRGQKAAYLKKHGLSEAGDVKFKGQTWAEGSRGYRKRQFDKDRPMIRENYKRYLENARNK